MLNLEFDGYSSFNLSYIEIEAEAKINIEKNSWLGIFCLSSVLADFTESYYPDLIVWAQSKFVAEFW